MTSLVNGGRGGEGREGEWTGGEGRGRGESSPLWDVQDHQPWAHGMHSLASGSYPVVHGAS